MTFSYRNLAVVFASALTRALSSAHLVEQSMAVIMYRLRLEAGLIGSIKSIPHFSNGCQATTRFNVLKSAFSGC